MPQKKTEADYYNEGRDAHMRKEPREANPYRNQQTAAERAVGAEANWDAGWDLEEKDLRGDD